LRWPLLASGDFRVDLEQKKNNITVYCCAVIVARRVLPS
jgi:hypothetical protein